MVKKSEDFVANVCGSQAGHISPPIKEQGESTGTDRTITDDRGTTNNGKLTGEITGNKELNNNNTLAH